MNDKIWKKNSGKLEKILGKDKKVSKRFESTKLKRNLRYMIVGAYILERN